MHPFCRIFALSLLWVPVTSLTQEPKSAPDQFQNQALVFERLETAYRMKSDGTGERDLHVIVRIQSSGAAQQFGVIAFPYASANESPVVKYIRVLKADGSTVETPSADAIDMPADVTRQAPLYSDLKEKHIPIRSLASGDKLEYEIATQIMRSEAPGQFWGATHFTAPGTLIVLKETLTLEVPVDKYVRVWSPNHKASIIEKDGRKIYSWTGQQLTPPPANDEAAKTDLPKDPDEDEERRKVPSVAWTTFHSWAEVGDWYRSLAAGQARVNETLKARAASIVAGAKTPEDEARAIYEYVSAHTRYVGIDFGVGRFQPHAAEEVLANQYGDCKDKDTLLEALLKARGIETAPALIGVGVAPVPELPSPAVFNHVITAVTLPAGRIWLDSTPQGAPFRYLVAPIRGQKALLVRAEGQASLEITPEQAPYAFVEHFEADGVLDPEGKIAAKIKASYRDDGEVLVRTLARTSAAADRDRVSQYIAGVTGFSGKTSNTSFTNEEDSSRPITVSYDYEKHPFGDWDSLRIVPLFPVTEFASLEDNASEPKLDIELGSPRTMTAISRIRLPDGYHTDLPDAVHAKTPFASFDLTYRFDGKQIVVERSIEVLKKKVAKTDWKQYKAFMKQIGEDTTSWIQLIPPAKPITVTMSHSATPGESTKNPDGTTTVKLHTRNENPVKSSTPEPKPAAEETDEKSIAELMQEFSEKARAYDWVGARAVLDKVKSKNEKAENLWSGYGYLEQVSNHDNKQAIADFRKEMEYHPDSLRTAEMLAELENRSGDAAGARDTLKTFLADHPNNLMLWYQLSASQTQAGDNEGALRTIDAASKQFPEERQLRIQMAGSLVRLNRLDEAAAAAKSALDGAEQAEILNDAAYVLSEAGRELQLAEQASRKSIAKLEEESAGISTEQANSRAFARANLLIASWDTLGWILYQQGEYDEARKWIEPAWRASLRDAIGSHLGEIEEKQGKMNVAAATFKLARTAETDATMPYVRQEIEAGLKRTGAAEAGSQNRAERARATSGGQENLQKLRTYKIKRPSAVSGWGTFRLEITTAGVIEAQQMSGEDKLTAIQPAVSAMKFPELLPEGSKAHLLRSAVISCSIGDTCEIVFVPDGGLQTERQ